MKNYCQHCLQETENPSLELIFQWGAEGGGERIYRNKEGRIISIGSSGGMLDEEEDPIITWQYQFPTIKSFWECFDRMNKNWFRLYPLFIHKEYKAFVNKQIESIAQKQDINEEWKRLINK